MHMVTVYALAALAVLAAPIHAQHKAGPFWKSVSAPQCDGLDYGGNYKGKGTPPNPWASDKCKNLHAVQASSEITYPGEKDPVKISFVTMARSGDTLGDGVFGALIDSKGQPMLKNGVTPIVSHNPDANNILTVYNNKMYAVTHFESPVPSMAYLSEVEQDSAGVLKYTKTQNIDFSKFYGLWSPCAGSISPWGSHLGSEEYEPDARRFFEDSTVKVEVDTITGQKYNVSKFLDESDVGTKEQWGLVNMAAYLGKDPSKWTKSADAIKDGLNPYNYGWPWEVKVTSEGKPDLQKLFAVGRMSYEQLTVMPDRVTSYGTDDGTAVMWLRFVSTAEGKFDEGELFCAQLVQNTPCADVNVCQGYDETNPKHKDGPASAFHASVSWLSMGKAKASEIALALTDFNKTGSSIQFKDMFDKAPFDTSDPALKEGSYPCPKDYKAVNTNGYKKDGKGGQTECLKIKKTREKWASRLETRRYAAMLGCNTEMEKWEGSAYDPIAQVMYTSISSASGAMAAKVPSGNGKPQDAIRIPKTASCGCVMETGFADSTYKTSYIKSHLCGSSAKIEAACNITSKDGLEALAKNIADVKDYGKKPGTATFACDDYLYNQCNKSEIANPDNLALMTEFGQLVIMEDTKEGHRNDAMWIQNLSDGKKTRVMTGPLGCEITGAMWFPNLGPGNNGQFSYLGVVVQHPYDESDGGGDTNAYKPIKPNDDAMRGYVGYLGPLKKVDRYVSAASSFSASMIVSFVSVLFVSVFVF